MLAAAKSAFSGRSRLARFFLMKGQKTTSSRMNMGSAGLGRQLQEKIVGIDGRGLARVHVRRHRRFIIAQSHAQDRGGGEHAAGLQPVGEAQPGRGQFPGLGKTQGRDQEKHQGQDHQQRRQVPDLEYAGNEKIKQDPGHEKKDAAERLGQEQVEPASSSRTAPEERGRVPGPGKNSGQ